MVLGMKATITDVCLSLCPSVTNTFEYDSNPKIVYLSRFKCIALNLVYSLIYHEYFCNISIILGKSFMLNACLFHPNYSFYN